MLSQRGLEALRAFVEGGSISAASARLHRTQPQVGRLLAGLEAELGFALFDRANRRLTLTAEGGRFYAQVERVLAGHDGLERLATELKLGQQDSHVRVLIAPHMVGALLTGPLAEMSRRLPGFSASVDARARLDIENWVGQEVFDLGITVVPLPHPALTVEEFCQTEVVVVMAPGHPLAALRTVAFTDLVKHDLVTTHARSLLRQHLDQMSRDAGIEARIRFEAANGLVVCQLARAGLGAALADSFVAQSSGAEGLVLRRFRPRIALAYGLLFPTWQPRSRATAELADLVTQAGRQGAAMLERRLRRTLPRRTAT
ncbi:LysR family transcriptional regulator [Muricoccus radiodurans]|uniref:LysR family transcriptional regulator n=1 Tax=Muricoccus radiodurans TaxID=2231721 RepID=UPI003CF87022